MYLKRDQENTSKKTKKKHTKHWKKDRQDHTNRLVAVNLILLDHSFYLYQAGSIKVLTATLLSFSER